MGFLFWLKRLVIDGCRWCALTSTLGQNPLMAYLMAVVMWRTKSGAALWLSDNNPRLEVADEL